MPVAFANFFLFYDKLLHLFINLFFRVNKLENTLARRYPIKDPNPIWKSRVSRVALFGFGPPPPVTVVGVA